MLGIKEKLRKEGGKKKLSDLVRCLYCVDMSYLNVSMAHAGGCWGGGGVKTAACDGG